MVMIIKTNIKIIIRFLGILQKDVECLRKTIFYIKQLYYYRNAVKYTTYQGDVVYICISESIVIPVYTNGQPINLDRKMLKVRCIDYYSNLFIILKLSCFLLENRPKVSRDQITLYLLNKLLLIKVICQYRKIT